MITVDAIVIEISKLELGPNDLLVLRVPAGWTVEQLNRFSEYVARAWEAKALPGQFICLPPVELDVVSAS
jgi:hypothetical protein